MKSPWLHSASRLPGAALALARTAAGTLGGLFFPPRCLACGTDLPETTMAPGEPPISTPFAPRRWLCGGCEGATDDWKIRPPCCETCSEPFDGALAGSFSCWNCRGQEFAFTRAVSARRSRGLAHEMVLRFKYRGDFALRHPLAAWLTEAIHTERERHADDPAPDALVPVPLHGKRSRERGFNQAAVLATLAGRRTGLPVLNGVLRRVRPTETQTHLNREERLRNLRGAFAVPRGRAAAAAISGRRLLLVDDIFTTGSTANECARVLVAAGAAEVRVVTAARR